MLSHSNRPTYPKSRAHGTGPVSCLMRDNAIGVLRGQPNREK
jgi:hypothetical protein